MAFYILNTNLFCLEPTYSLPTARGTYSGRQGPLLVEIFKQEITLWISRHEIISETQTETWTTQNNNYRQRDKISSIVKRKCLLTSFISFKR